MIVTLTNLLFIPIIDLQKLNRYCVYCNNRSILIMSSKQAEAQPSGYQKYVQKRKKDLQNPKPPDSKEYIRLSEAGKKEYMKYVRKAYEMMFFWIGFGGLMGYLTYNSCNRIGIIRNRPNFKMIRGILTVLPSVVFPYHGIKFMMYYKRVGAREVAKNAQNLISQEEYQRMVEEQSKVNLTK